MGRLPLLFVVGALVALTHGERVVNMEVNAPIVEKEEVDPQPPNPFTVVPHSTEVPTQAPTTKPTQPPTTSPTTKPTVPTTIPSTTKPTPPTPPPITKPTTPSTTAAPTSKPTSPPKPTPSPPTPKPPQPPANVDPVTGDWHVNYTTPQVGACIFAHMAIQIEVPYLTKNKHTWHAHVDVPKNANATGSCNNLEESLKLTWENNWIEFSFSKHVDAKWYIVDKITFNISKDEKNFPNADNSTSTVALVYEHNLFNTTEKMSYKCAHVQTFNMTMPNLNTTLGYLHVSHLQLEAFAAEKSTGFANAVDCAPSGTPDIIPIAAGCALAALIIIVLGAYLIGRKRSQARGYLSMFTETKREEDYIPMKNLSCFN